MDNIILIGFSTTGKSQVGEMVARRLGWGFIDTDAEIARRAGKSIAEIFAQDGEDHFRKLEHQAILEACQKERQVIATGGGAVVDPANLEVMLQRGLVVCLDARPKTIYRRLRQDTEKAAPLRPLLAGPDPLKRIESLKAQRQPYYAIAHYTIATDDLNLEEVAERVVVAWQGWQESGGPQIVEVRTASANYPVLVDWGSLEALGQEMVRAGLRGRAILVSDSTVFPLYGETAISSLRRAGISVISCTVPAGEATKTIETATGVYDFLVARRVERGDTIVALGGGMVGDLAGFVAATFLRGLSWVVVPTSLVAMVDASIGGKVAVNHPQAKNLIGAFYQPRFVLADVKTLATLPQRELTSGWAEVIKHGAIQDAELFSFLENEVDSLVQLEPRATAWAIARSAQVKAEVVGQDERETIGKRAILNFGHTIGHGLEAATGYGQLLHGEAVAIGMVGAARLSQRLNLIGEAEVARLKELLQHFSLPVSARVDIQKILSAMALDKKTRQGEVRWVLLKGIGRVVRRGRVPRAHIIAVLEELLKDVG